MGSSDFMNMKTPGKAILKTPARGLLKKENAAFHRVGATMTVNRKGKAASHTPHPKTPGFKLHQTTIKPNVVITKPLGDKTPFPNRHLNYAPLQTPAPQVGKIAKLSLLADGDITAQTPGAVLRPSSTRKSLRAPRLSDSGGRTRAFEFKTPVTNGNHWDVSDGELDVHEVVAEAQEAQLEVEDYDEIEYMPPTAHEPSYEPSFIMPNYKELGQNLLRMACSDAFREVDAMSQEIDFVDLTNPMEVYESGVIQIPDILQLSPLAEEEDPFDPRSFHSTETRQPEPPVSLPARPTTRVTRSTSSALLATQSKTKEPPRPTQAMTSKAASTKAETTTTTSTRPGLRPHTSMSRRPTSATSVATIERPKTSTSMRPDTSKKGLVKASTTGHIAPPPLARTARTLRPASNSNPPAHGVVKAAARSAAVTASRTGKGTVMPRQDELVLEVEPSAHDDEDFLFSVQ